MKIFLGVAQNKREFEFKLNKLLNNLFFCCCNSNFKRANIRSSLGNYNVPRYIKYSYTFHQYMKVIAF